MQRQHPPDKGGLRKRPEGEPFTFPIGKQGDSPLSGGEIQKQTPSPLRGDPPYQGDNGKNLPPSGRTRLIRGTTATPPSGGSRKRPEGEPKRPEGEPKRPEGEPKRPEGEPVSIPDREAGRFPKNKPSSFFLIDSLSFQGNSLLKIAVKDDFIFIYYFLYTKRHQQNSMNTLTGQQRCTKRQQETQRQSHVENH